MDELYHGFGGCQFGDIAASLVNGDPYMVFADFDAYQEAQRLSGTVYRDKAAWSKMAFLNTACSGFFASDRSIHDYATTIWNATPLK